MGRRILEDIQRTQGKNNKSTNTITTQKKRKIQSRNRRIRTCYRRSTVPRTGWKMETNSVFIKKNATSGKKLQNL